MHEAPFFTVHDHLRVQRQIEERAHDLWCAGGCSGLSALADWLQAEREILEQFVLVYALRRSARREPYQRQAAEAKMPRQGNAILRPRPATKSRKLLPTTVPL